MELDMEALEQRLKDTLSPQRYRHSLGVATYAAALAAHWGLDAERAYRAGLLHDLMRGLEDDALLQAARSYQVPVGKPELESPRLLHGPLAARVLEQDYGCDDPLLLEAIRLHTVPDPEMSDFAKLIFLVDIAEPGRKPWPRLAEIRRLARIDLDAAMALALQDSLEYLQSCGKKPHPDTESIRDAFLAKAARKRDGGKKQDE